MRSVLEAAKGTANKTLCMGFLSNVDSSILKLKAIDGFRIGSMGEEQGLDFLASAERTSVEAISERVRAVDLLLNLKENKFFYVAKSFENLPVVPSDPAPEPKSDHTSMLISLIELSLRLRLVRLFKEGDIRLINSYAFSVDTHRKVKRTLRGVQTNQLTSRVLFTLTDEEVPRLRAFLKSVDLHRPRDFRELAFSLFDESYGIREPALAFLCLMISMEVMFNISQKASVSKEVSTRCSALLSNDMNRRKKIAEEIQTMYRKRTKIVHYGQMGIVQEKDVLDLRQYVRESIKAILLKGLDKRELIGSLGKSFLSNRVLP